MPEIIEHFVEYYGKCSTCKYKDTAEGDEPCNECLTTPVNTYSKTPVNYESSSD